MTTAHYRIVGAVVDAIKAAGVASGRVYRARTRAISVDAPYAVVVRVSRSASQQPEVLGGRTSWKTLLEIECYGRNAGGSPDEAADQIVEDVFACLATVPNLGGLAQDVEPLEGDTLAWDFDELDANLGCITAKFLISHQTTGRTLT